MFIDYTYFTGDIALPSRMLQGDNAIITTYITRYEKEALLHLLGYDLYKELAAQKTADSLDAKWTAFQNGAEYTVSMGGSDYTVKWEGLINTPKISFLAYYVYFNVIRDNVTNTSVLGEILALPENGMRVTPTDKMVHSYNKFVELYGSMEDNDLHPSAYRYLYENESDFDLWVFTPKEKINKFGI